MNKNKLLSILLILVIYAICASTSYVFFSEAASGSNEKDSSTAAGASDSLTFDSDFPKTEACPLNGELYSRQQKDWWEQHRPLGVMIENHEDARPQSGLSLADIVYEAIAEGGITRFLSVFYCQPAKEIGPIRSARTYFLDFISEYGSNPLYAHVGGANTPGPADALSQIEEYGWANFNDLNQFSVGFPTFWRDYDRLGHPAATEHTMYSKTETLWKFAADNRGLNAKDEDGTPWAKGFVQYSFKDDAAVSQRPESQSIKLEFWTRDPAYVVDWMYDPATNMYKRSNGGVAHVDRNTNKQLTTKNIVVLTMEESHANDGYENNVHLLYDTISSGEANVFMDGKQIVGTWSKDSRTSRTMLFDSNGSQIKLDRGKIWFEILPTDGVITVK